MKNIKSFNVADITIEIACALKYDDNTFSAPTKEFLVEKTNSEVVCIFHEFGIPPKIFSDNAVEVFRDPPWAIYHDKNGWIYLGISSFPGDNTLELVAYFSEDYSSGRIYHNDSQLFLKGNSNSILFFPTDQVFLTQLLSLRNGVLLHSSGMIYDNKGILFVGHSGAGKSTTAQLFINANEFDERKCTLLCDDRNIIRHINNQWFLFGTWSHGDINLVSSKCAPLKAIFFINQSMENIIAIQPDKNENFLRILPFVIRGYRTSLWWNNTINITKQITEQIPCFSMDFDKSGKIVNIIKEYLDSNLDD